MNRRPPDSGFAPVKSVSKIRLLIADGHEIARAGARAILDQIAHITIVSEAATIAAARQTLDRHEVDLALIELHFPDGNGIDLCLQIRASSPHMQVLFFTRSIDDALIVSALEAGAAGVLSKTVSGQSLVRAIETVWNGYAIIDRGVLQRSIAHLHSLSVATGKKARTGLSAQELKIMELVTQGKTNKEIGDALGLSTTSVRNRMGHVYDKLHVTRRAQAASVFLEYRRTSSSTSMADRVALPPS